MELSPRIKLQINTILKVEVDKTVRVCHLAKKKTACDPTMPTYDEVIERMS